MDTKPTNAEAFVELDAARRSLMAVLERLRVNDWNQPTLCEGWRVREVVSHLAFAPDARFSRVLHRMVSARGRVDVHPDRDRFYVAAVFAAQRGAAFGPAGPDARTPCVEHRGFLELRPHMNLDRGAAHHQPIGFSSALSALSSRAMSCR